MQEQQSGGVRQPEHRKKRGTPVAIILLGILVAGSALSRQGWVTSHLSQRKVVARKASEERESDMPPPGYLMRRWGGIAEPQPVRKSLLAPDAPTAVSNWVPLGPTQITDVGSNTIYEPSLGRINCVAVSPSDPNRILAGAGSGGVWLSTDGGQNWSPRTDKLPVLGVSDIKFAPNDPNTVYMATGDFDASASPSVGIYKSTDGGANWSPTGLVIPEANFRIISKIAVHPTNSNIVFASHIDGIYRTLNGGTDWQSLNPSGAIGGDFPSYDVKFQPGNPSVVYAMGPGGAFRRSLDTGGSWQPISPGLPNSSTVQRCQIGVTPGDPNTVYVICGRNQLNGVYRSTNGGASFSPTSGTPGAQAAFGNQATYDMAITVASANDLYIGGVVGFHSTNGGASWTTIYGDEGGFVPGQVVAHVDVHDLQIANGALYAATDGGLHRSTDGGLHWTDLSQKLYVAEIYDFSISEQNPSLVYAGEQDNGLNRLRSGKWEHVQAGDWGQPLIHPKSTDLVFAGSNGGDFKTVDGFQNFVIPMNITNEPKRFPGPPFAVDPNDLQVAYAGYKNVHKSTTFGDSGSWSPVTNFTDNGIVITIAVAPGDPRVLYASRGDFSITPNTFHLIRSTDSGNSGSWGSVAGNGLPNKLVTGIAIDPANPNRVWVVLEDSQGQVVYRTENGGGLWTNYTGSLSSRSVRTIVYQKGSQDGVYIGTNSGIFFRDATMADWQPFNTNLPNAIVNDLQINYASGRLRAATYGRGVWETLLPGTVLNSLLNVSTRLQVGTGDNILIGGFILTGSGNKTVLLRAIGPSLSAFLPGAMANPTLELRNGGGTVLASNDNWKVTQTGGVITGNQFFAIKSTGLAPGNDSESAIVGTLPPGNYTAVLRGANDSTGIAVVEGYDLSQATAKFGNISTRGFVQVGDGAMIGGFIIGNQSAPVVVRAIGPSLGQFGVPSPLANPTVELRDVNGVLIDSNDNWKVRDSNGGSQQAEIEATGLQPANDLESALVRTVSPGNYTAVVRGAANGIGNAVVEAYNLQ
jgi:photosystem II stability/assembly factor-like uncharacterized protein